MKFKPMLEWDKGSVWIVVFSVVIVALLPASFVMSRSWNKKILAEQEKAGTSELEALKKARVKYVLPQFHPKISEVSFTAEPNAAIDAHFRDARTSAAAQVASVAGAAEDFNRGAGERAAGVGRSEFRPLVEGLFPKVALSESEAANPNAANDKEQAKLNEAEDKFLGKRGNANPFLALLKTVNAGAPSANDTLFAQMKDQRAREEEKITQGKRKLDPDEEKRLADLMKGSRLGEYQHRARTIGVYMTIDALPLPLNDESARMGRQGGSEPLGDLIEPFATLPMGTIERKDLTRPKMFMHQWNLWVLSDLLSAVRLANTGPDGKLLGVDQATVKRVERIALRNPDGMMTLDPKPAAEEDPYAVVPTSPVPPAETTPGLAALDPSVSITGRVRGGWNKYYEVRRADVTCVVASERLQQFLGAIARTNYMAVTDLDIDKEVDTWGELSQGYYYGDEHVVRVTMSIESVWLKGWLQPLMPVEIQTALGMEVPPEPVPADGSAPPPPPPGGG